MRKSEYAAKLIPRRTFVRRAADSRLHVCCVLAWIDPFEIQFFPVCLAYGGGKPVRISYLDVSPVQELLAWD